MIEDLIGKLGIGAGIVVVAYAVIHKVLGPLVEYVIQRKKKADADAPDQDAELRKLPAKVIALEVNWKHLTTQVIDLSKGLSERAAELTRVLEEQAIAADNKMDMVLAELKSLREDHEAQHRMLADRMAEQYRVLGERIKGVETDIKHLENKPRGAR